MRLPFKLTIINIGFTIACVLAAIWFVVMSGMSFSNEGFMPHGHCYMWTPSLVWTMVITDTLIGLAYVSISVCLYVLVRQIRLPFSAMFLAFGVFIAACGATHFMSVYTLWLPNYWLDALIKVITAIASVFTAILMIPLFPKVVAFATAARLSEERKNQLEVTVRALEEEREVRERFVTALSHDIRNPLTGARGYAQLLISKMNDPDISSIKNLSERVISNIDRADSMIRDLLDANRIKAGEGIPITIEDCRLDRVVDSVVKHLQELHGPNFRMHNEAGEIRGRWDCASLRRVIENLAGNAIKYGAVHSVVTISLFKRDEWTEIAVHNEGNVISPDDQKTLFDSFRRIESAVSSGQTGWGIGLTLVRAISEAHGGTVRVESSKENGTTFYVRLPIIEIERRAHFQ